MKKHVVRGIIIGLSYYLIWYTLDRAFFVIASHSPSRIAYGMLSSWWAALYLCSYLEIKIKDIWYLIAPGIPYAAFLASRRHDVGYSMLGNLTFLLFLLSPFLMNLLLSILKKGLVKKEILFRE